MELYIVVWAGILGAIIGSFLNVVILRSFTGRSINGRSGCASCGAPLRWFELVPVVSFAIQRGRCRTCGTKLSWQYPLVELGTTALFALTASQLQLSLSISSLLVAVFYCAVMSLLVVITVYDIKHKIIPNRFVYSLIVLSGVFVVLDFSAVRLLAGPLLWAPLALLWQISGGRWIGLGDAKLVWVFGWILGLMSGLSAVVFGFWIGALFGIVVLLSGQLRNGGKTEIPFGPFLVLGFLLVLFTGLQATDVVALLL